MEEAKAMAAQQQQNFLFQKQQQQHQYLLLQNQQQQQAISRFPSNIDAHLRTTPGVLHHRPNNNQQNPNSTPIPNPNLNPTPNLQQHKHIRPFNPADLQMAYQDAWRVCHPDFKRPFSSLEDVCERLLPYHVVADYEAEEEDKILDSDTTGQMPSRSQQWDNNIAAKVAEFTATFEKQAFAFNVISRKRAMGESRSEERLMVEKALLQEEKKAMLDLRAEIESREKAGREAHEAKLRMAAMVQAEQARAEIMARGPMRANALRSQGGNLQIGHDIREQPHGVNLNEMMNGWGSNAQRDERESSEDFLNDEETENEDTSVQNNWHGVGEFDLNSR
ncbi:BRAHMA-interacting protein 2 [Hibiscus trionum]|uniref:BRAHMA-interacting protein 2 n=1 Tax=Hibiscus trionum TaxID=183268 RepID=A0A9W7MNZ7_HIBTR|nr:BRAHMA-interacting protein 2 [Hibiscus trionum]